MNLVLLQVKNIRELFSAVKIRERDVSWQMQMQQEAGTRCTGTQFRPRCPSRSTSAHLISPRRLPILSPVRTVKVAGSSEPSSLTHLFVVPLSRTRIPYIVHEVTREQCPTQRSDVLKPLATSSPGAPSRPSSRSHQPVRALPTKWSSSPVCITA